MLRCGNGSQAGPPLVRRRTPSSRTRASTPPAIGAPTCCAIWAHTGTSCKPPGDAFQLAAHLPVPQRELEGDDALRELTRRYITSHGPATVQDLAWWSGLTVTSAKRGAALLGDELVTVQEVGESGGSAGQTRSAAAGRREPLRHCS